MQTIFHRLPDTSHRTGGNLEHQHCTMQMLPPLPELCNCVIYELYDGSAAGWSCAARGERHLWPPQVPVLPLQRWVGVGLLSVNPSVMSRLPGRDRPSSQTGTIYTCHTSPGCTEATKSMLKPSQTFPKSEGLRVGFKPITDPEYENNVYFFPLLSHFLSCGAGFVF